MAPPPWGSCHGGAVTERAVLARGIGCVHHLRGYQAQLDVSVPVRGIDCILQPLRQPLRHRVFVPVRGMSCVRADVLQPPTGQVTVPVRGIDCILCYICTISTVTVPARGIGCIGKTAQSSAVRRDDYSTCLPALQGGQGSSPRWGVNRVAILPLLNWRRMAS